MVSESMADAQEASKVIREDLGRAGWVENIAKCKWEPAHQRMWVGFDIRRPVAW